jgi:hypothetical protein
LLQLLYLVLDSLSDENGGRSLSTRAKHSIMEQNVCPLIGRSRRGGNACNPAAPPLQYNYKVIRLKDATYAELRQLKVVIGTKTDDEVVKYLLRNQHRNDK